MGRFISEDPLGLAGGNSNLYSYALDDPTNFVDPSGLTTTIYYWSSTGIPGTGNFLWGHVAISVNGSAGQAYISWMPGGPPQLPTGSSVVNDDYLKATISNGLPMDISNEGGRLPQQVQLEGLNEQAILDWWNSYKKNPTFTMLGRNCSTTAAAALSAGGAGGPFGLVPTPADIYQAAQNNQQYGPNWNWNLTFNNPHYKNYVLH